jgi:Ca2+/H+ antiporter
MAGATVIVAAVVYDGRSRRWEGVALIGIYAGIAVWFGFAGNR